MQNVDWRSSKKVQTVTIGMRICWKRTTMIEVNKELKSQNLLIVSIRMRIFWKRTTRKEVYRQFKESQMAHIVLIRMRIFKTYHNDENNR